MRKFLKKKQDGKKRSPVQRERDHLAIVLEDVDSKMGLVVETVDLLNGKIDKNHKEFLDFRKETGWEFGQIREVLKEHTGTLKEHGGILKEHSANFKVILEYLLKIDNKIQEIKAEIIKIKKEKINLKDFLRLEERVEKVEKENTAMRLILNKLAAS